MPPAPISHVVEEVRVDVSLAHLDDPDYVEDPPPVVYAVVAGYGALGALVGESAFPVVGADLAAALQRARTDFVQAFRPSPEAWGRRCKLALGNVA